MTLMMLMIMMMMMLMMIMIMIMIMIMMMMMACSSGASPQEGGVPQHCANPNAVVVARVRRIEKAHAACDGAGGA